MSEKPPSGAEKKRRKTRGEIAQHIADLVRLGWRPTEDELRRFGASMPAPVDGALDDGAADFAQLGEPDMENPALALEWVRRALMKGMYLGATRAMTPELEKRLRHVKDFSAVCGMTQNRIALEEIAARVDKLVADATELRGSTRKGAVNGRAPGSRGTPRGPRPLPPVTDDPLDS